MLQGCAPRFLLWGSWTSCWAAAGRVYGSLNPSLVGGQLGDRWLNGTVFPPAVMRFMGDAPLKGQSELDVLCTLLKVSPAPPGAPLPALWLGFAICQRGLQPLGWEPCGPMRSASRWWGGFWRRDARPVFRSPLCSCGHVTCDLARPPTAVQGP